MFVETPFMPKGRVSVAAGSFGPPGLQLIPPPQLKALPPVISRHADLGLCPVGGNEVVCPPDSFEYYNSILSPLGFSVIRGGQALGRSYPEDTAYNVVVAGKFALLNPKACDKVLLKRLSESFEIIPIRQGYAKCAVCPVSETAVITADAGIARRALGAGLDVLEISNRGVLLPPYDSGFFGGATGMISENTLAVNGSLSKMESGNDISAFLNRHGVTVLEISSGPPFDTGSLIPLMITADNS